MLHGRIRRWWWKRSHQRFYADQTSRSYQLNAGSERGFQALANDLKELLLPQPDDVVLDIGGGTGELSAAVFACCRKIVVADLCRPNRTSRDFVMADMMKLPFAKKSFTIVFAHSVFPHFGSEADATVALREWTELLKNNGTLFIGDIPERARLKTTVFRGLQKDTIIDTGKYWFAISMLSYFSRKRLTAVLESLGLETQSLDQPAIRRFHKERFDILAKKPEVNCRR